jgi:transposase InsO family protein
VPHLSLPGHRCRLGGEVDITYVPTGEGWLFVASVLDVFSRRLVDSGICPS